ncbi:CDP-glucose 4,6-dehydratase [Candidatus Magnetaquicoccus inordinatus]|uniref:CDP-glucose 4,6-dehydratase n=1 Tax=Candidatus Magnetaquicoccus inordinatus TaxID=2496818 RepID=UPI00102ABEEA|nr:CDP-glucose 4,6-dehydratase [Candidatus Magnetaquicoccus inordinatus]
MVDRQFWRGKRVLLTGHSGFKGSWLSIWLTEMGAELCGLALPPPTTPSLFVEARLAERMVSHEGDIRDAEVVLRVMREWQPEIVIHMAAQALVRHSYVDPVGTYATNVLGTVHLLEAVRQVASVRVVINVTSDKCYENREWWWGYREEEAMGGHDPYSSSKGCAELVSSAYRRSFLQQAGVALASVRAGNVIGGGDWAVDRLLPDILRGLAQGVPILIRHPHALRPWQHVLEPLSGYLLLAQRLFSEGESFAEGWNFGPHDADVRPVQWIVEQMCHMWGEGAEWRLAEGVHPHEAHLLRLDSSKARMRLGWQPRWPLATALQRCIQWQHSWLAGVAVAPLCVEQIAAYENDGEQVG